MFNKQSLWHVFYLFIFRLWRFWFLCLHPVAWSCVYSASLVQPSLRSPRAFVEQGESLKRHSFFNTSHFGAAQDLRKKTKKCWHGKCFIKTLLIYTSSKWEATFWFFWSRVSGHFAREGPMFTVFWLRFWSPTTHEGNICLFIWWILHFVDRVAADCDGEESLDTAHCSVPPIFWPAARRLWKVKPHG